MKTIFSTIIFILLHVYSYAQDSFNKLPIAAKINCPMLLIDEHIISNKNIITSKEDVTEVRVLIDKPNREKQEHYNLSANGILIVTLKNNPSYKTQTELNTFLDLDENNPVYVNGYLLEHDTYTIATESIAAVELVAPNKENNLTQKVINVWTLTQEERENGCALSQMK